MDIDLILDRVMYAISNCIHNKYGNIGYFVGLDEDSKEFEVTIYNRKSAEIGRMSEEESEKHLLERIIVDLSHINKENGYDIIDYVVTEIEKKIHSVD